MNHWQFCQHVWPMLVELYRLLWKMEMSHIKKIEKMLSPKMVERMSKNEKLRMAVIQHFHMSTYLAESYGYLKALLHTGHCPTPEQVATLVKDHLEPMEHHHHLMMEAMEEMKKEMEEMKKKHKDKVMDDMEPMEEMMAEMKETHKRVAEIIEQLKKI